MCTNDSHICFFITDYLSEVTDLFDFKEQSEGNDLMLKLRIRAERLCWLGLHSANIFS